MPRSADDTRRRILDAAESCFATDGIVGATFADILDAAGQRNNSAIQYHFGDRIGLLEAITSRRVEQMAVHRDRLLDDLPSEPTVRDLVEVIIAPLAAMLGEPGGSAYLRIQAELLAHPNRDELPELLSQPWSRPGLERVQALLVESLPPHSVVLGAVRTVLATTLIFHSLADRARLTDEAADHEDFVRGLVHAVVAILETVMDEPA
ncbi:TetR/AcrR family transcriptional regulator [Actinospongicola halichondriae]|uniref:TetR/AcrR family transcriptional regulator n=1 Tax=Actinospongicola halichondriae TaxID=3236844 RepID=UPI003D5C2BBE